MQFKEKLQTKSEDIRMSDEARGLLGLRLVRVIHECRREAFETEACLGCSHVRPTEASVQSVENAEREPPRRA